MSGNCSYIVWWRHRKCSGKNKRQAVHAKIILFGVSLIASDVDEILPRSWFERPAVDHGAFVPCRRRMGTTEGILQAGDNQGNFHSGAKAEQETASSPALPFSHQSRLKLHLLGSHFQGFAGQSRVPGLCPASLSLWKLLYLCLRKGQSYWFLSAVAL